MGEILFTDDFYENAARVLRPGGLIVNQCGVPAMQSDELRTTSLRRKKFFPTVSAYVAAVPTYVGGFMTLGVAVKGAAIATDAATAASRAGAAGILGRTRYWSPAMHAASFALPPYIGECLPR